MWFACEPETTNKIRFDQFVYSITESHLKYSIKRKVKLLTAVFKYWDRIFYSCNTNRTWKAAVVIKYPLSTLNYHIIEYLLTNTVNNGYLVSTAAFHVMLHEEIWVWREALFHQLHGLNDSVRISITNNWIKWFSLIYKYFSCKLSWAHEVIVIVIVLSLQYALKGYPRMNF